MTRSAAAGRTPPVAGGGRAYFLDIDGTLAEFAPEPEQMSLDPAARDLVDRLHHAAGGAVALISGRAIVEIDRLFPGSRFPAAGQHGAERRDAAGRIFSTASAPAELALVRTRLTALVERHPGLILEDKGLSLALHYRRAPRLAGYAHRALRALQPLAGPRYAIQSGKRIVELGPAGRDKGDAVLDFMQEGPFRGRTPVFIGDDVTDEHAFAAVNRLGGLSIKVGPGATAAAWRLAGVPAVRRWLADSLAAAESGGAPAARRAP